MIKVFGYPGSTCTRKVLMVLNERQCPFEFITVDLAKGEQKKAEHLERHPFGVVPVINDDGFFLYESGAIIRYLDAKLPGVKLTPQDKHGFGRMEQWINVAGSYFSEPALQLIKQLYWGKKQGHEPNEAVVKAARSKVDHALSVIDKALTHHSYLAGEVFSLAEISWMPYIDYLFPSGLDELVNKHLHVRTWWERISQRSAWLKTVGQRS